MSEGPPRERTPGEPNTPPVESPQSIRVEQLGRFIQVKRSRDRLTLEQAAEQCGVSAATLSRLERQWTARSSNSGNKLQPDTRTVVNLTRWLGIPIEHVLDVQPSTPAAAETDEASRSVPDIVEAHLRADRNLDSVTAEALAQMFRAAYEQFSQLGATRSERTLEHQHPEPRRGVQGGEDEIE